MTGEQFVQWADLLPEPSLMVSGEGLILAANQATQTKLGLLKGELDGRSLAELVLESADKIALYLRECSRTRSPIYLLWVVRQRDRVIECRVEGASLLSAERPADTRLLLRLIPQEDASPSFADLNRKIAELNDEVRRCRQTEEELRQQREMLQRTLTSMGDALITTDPWGRVTFLNLVAESLTGWSNAEAAGRELGEVLCIVDEETREPVENLVAGVLRASRGTALANHNVLVSRGGAERVIAHTAAPIHDGEGRLSGMVLVFRDVSEQRDAHWQRERYLRAIIDATPECIKVMDSQGRLVEINPAGLAMVEAEGEFQDLMKTLVYDLIAPEHREAFRALHEQVCRGEPGTLEFDILGRRGTRRTVQTQAVPLQTPQGICYLAVTRDITRQRQAEQEQRRLTSILEYSRDFIGIAGLNQRALFLNRAGQRLVGLDSLEQVRETVILDYFSEEERERVQREIMPVLLEKGHWDEEVAFRHFRTGERIPVRWNVFTLPDPSTGQVGFFACVARDIRVEKRNAAILEGQKRVLEMAVQGAPLTEVLEGLCEIVEWHAEAPGIATIMMLEEDGVHLRPVAGRRSPSEWTSAVDLLRIGPCANSCGTAAYRKERVIVEDIATSPLWSDFRERALSQGLRACWATPVLGAQGQVLATFTVYYRSTRIPGENDLRLVDLLVQTAGVVLEQRRAERALRASEEWFRQVVDSNMVGIFFWAGEGQVWNANDAYLQLIGYSRDDLRAGLVNWRSLTVTAHQDRDERSVEEIACTGRCTPYETEYVRKDGSRIPVLVGRARRPGFQDEGVGFVLDITQRVRAEDQAREATRKAEAHAAQLERSEARYRLLFERNLAAVLITEEGGRVLECNSSFVQMLGYSSKEEVLRYQAQDFYTNLDTRAHLLAKLREHGHLQSHEMCFRHKSGQPVWVIANVSRLELDGKVLLHGTVVDITERKQLEEQFRQSQKMEAVGRLAGGVAHDFNNLLTIISGNSDLLLTCMRWDDPTREMIAQIREAGERATMLTRQLLAFSRKTVLEPKVLDLNVQVRQMATMLRRLIGEDIELETSLAAEVGRVKVDPSQLEQAVINLCVNSRDAMPQGGKITLETGDAELDSVYAQRHPGVRPGSYVLLSVSDTGHGMDEATKARIFEPFFTTKEPGKGTGLGLAMIYGFVKQSGGHIVVSSEPGQGTTVNLYLPQEREAVASWRSNLNLGPMPRGSETILLVEDEVGVRALARYVLQSRGYVVLEASDGREALRIAEQHAGPIHLLITDVVMPYGI